MDENASFGYLVRRRRKALDLTQAELAQLVCCVLTTVKKIETDVRRPSQEMAERLADCLCVPVSERTVFLQAARGKRSPLHLTSPNEPLERPASNHVEAVDISQHQTAVLLQLIDDLDLRAILEIAVAVWLEVDYDKVWAALHRHEEIQHRGSSRAAQLHDLQTLAALSELRADDNKRVETALLEARYAEATGNYGLAIAAATHAVALAATVSDSAAETAGYVRWGRRQIARVRKSLEQLTAHAAMAQDDERAILLSEVEQLVTSLEALLHTLRHHL